MLLHFFLQILLYLLASLISVFVQYLLFKLSHSFIFLFSDFCSIYLFIYLYSASRSYECTTHFAIMFNQLYNYCVITLMYYSLAFTFFYFVQHLFRFQILLHFLSHTFCICLVFTFVCHFRLFVFMFCRSLHYTLLQIFGVFICSVHTFILVVVLHSAFRNFNIYPWHHTVILF